LAAAFIAASSSSNFLRAMAYAVASSANLYLSAAAFLEASPLSQGAAFAAATAALNLAIVAWSAILFLSSAES
jgi:hypothetical protein